jgi:hypothetical protein
MVAQFVASNEHAGVALGGLLLAGVAILALQAHGGWLTDVDHSVTAWLVARRNPTSDHLALAVTNFLGPEETAGGGGAVRDPGAVARSALC